MRFLLAVLILACAVRGFAGYETRRNLPDSSELLSTIQAADPLQDEIDTRPYKLNYYEKDYIIYPQAEYEIWGLVVSHNNIHSIADIYHDKTSVDIKDLCLIWGDNLNPDVYQQAKFWSGAWTCNIEFEDRSSYSKFRGDQLSNNHILAESEALREKIRNIRVGDQIYLGGKLINYHPVENANQLRKTSLVREDVGNGACEVFMVEQARVLKRGNIFLNQLKLISSWLIIFLLIVIPARFLYSAYK